MDDFVVFLAIILSTVGIFLTAVVVGKYKKDLVEWYEEGRRLKELKKLTKERAFALGLATNEEVFEHVLNVRDEESYDPRSLNQRERSLVTGKRIGNHPPGNRIGPNRNQNITSAQRVRQVDNLVVPLPPNATQDSAAKAVGQEDVLHEEEQNPKRVRPFAGGNEQTSPGYDTNLGMMSNNHDPATDPDPITAITATDPETVEIRVVGHPISPNKHGDMILDLKDGPPSNHDHVGRVNYTTERHQQRQQQNGSAVTSNAITKNERFQMLQQVDNFENEKFNDRFYFSIAELKDEHFPVRCVIKQGNSVLGYKKTTSDFVSIFSSDASRRSEDKRMELIFEQGPYELSKVDCVTVVNGPLKGAGNPSSISRPAPTDESDPSGILTQYRIPIEYIFEVDRDPITRRYKIMTICTHENGFAPVYFLNAYEHVEHKTKTKSTKKGKQKTINYQKKRTKVNFFPMHMGNNVASVNEKTRGYVWRFEPRISKIQLDSVRGELVSGGVSTIQKANHDRSVAIGRRHQHAGTNSVNEEIYFSDDESESSLRLATSSANLQYADDDIEFGAALECSQLLGSNNHSNTGNAGNNGQGSQGMIYNSRDEYMMLHKQGTKIKWSIVVEKNELCFAPPVLRATNHNVFFALNVRRMALGEFLYEEQHRKECVKMVEWLRTTSQGLPQQFYNTYNRVQAANLVSYTAAYNDHDVIDVDINMHEQQQKQQQKPLLGSSLICYSILLPYLLGAVEGKHFEARNASNEEMFVGLCHFMGAPLIDRTGTYNPGLKLKITHPIPFWDGKYDPGEFDLIMIKRVGDIVERYLLGLPSGNRYCGEHDVKDPNLYILWSGGIDTTAVVIAFFMYMDELEKKMGSHSQAFNNITNRIVIAYCDRSINEYPLFYEKYISTSNSSNKFKSYKITGHVRDFIDGKKFVVTGDPGDMIMGTFLMSDFCKPKLDIVTSNAKAKNFKKQKKTLCNNPLYCRLSDPWRDVFPILLKNRGFLGTKYDTNTEANRLAWIRFLEPLCAKAPIPIKSAFDLLWWLTYSCKYEHDLLRVLYNREDYVEYSIPSLQQHAANKKNHNTASSSSKNNNNTSTSRTRTSSSLMPRLNPNLLKTVINFYGGEYGRENQFYEFDFWSFKRHEEKMADKMLWSSYKWPMKKFILAFTKDKEYFQYKIKAVSVRNSWGYQMAIDNEFNIIRWGKYSSSLKRLQEKYPGLLLQKKFMTESVCKQKGLNLGAASHTGHTEGMIPSSTNNKEFFQKHYKESLKNLAPMKTSKEKEHGNFDPTICAALCAGGVFAAALTAENVGDMGWLGGLDGGSGGDVGE